MDSEEREAYLLDLERKHTQARKARALEELRREPRDSAWASETETMLRAAADNLDKKRYPTSRVTSIDCRSTICSVEVDQSDRDEQDAFAGALETAFRTRGARRRGRRSSWRGDGAGPCS